MFSVVFLSAHRGSLSCNALKQARSLHPTSGVKEPPFQCKGPDGKEAYRPWKDQMCDSYNSLKTDVSFPYFNVQ